MISSVIHKLLKQFKFRSHTEYQFSASILFFLLAAFIYLSTNRPLYRVSCEIEIIKNRGLSLEEVSRALKSKALVAKTLGQLSLELSYFNASHPDHEIYGDSLPVRLKGDVNTNFVDQFFISALSSHSYRIEHQDTVQFFEINELVDRYYGKFKIIRGPAFRSHFQPMLVKITRPEKLLDNYYGNLSLMQDESSNAITLRILNGNPLKAEDFFNKLLDNYLSTIPSPIPVKIPAFKKKFPSPDRQQLDLVEAIKPYLHLKVSQFAQLPYIEEVQNQGLRGRMETFNQLELDKQRLLGAEKIDDLAIRADDKKLYELKEDITSQIALWQKGKSAVDALPSGSATTPGPIKRLGGYYAADAPNPFWIYGAALLAGILLPLSFSLSTFSAASLFRAARLRGQTLLEKIKIWLSRHQID